MVFGGIVTPRLRVCVANAGHGVDNDNEDDEHGEEEEEEEDEEEEGDEEEIFEVDEEELLEDWLERGLDPAAFDPMVLLQMWEAEEPEVTCILRPAFGFEVILCRRGRVVCILGYCI